MSPAPCKYANHVLSKLEPGGGGATCFHIAALDDI